MLDRRLSLLGVTRRCVRRPPANRHHAACTLGTAASFHREVVDCVSPQGDSLQRPLLKIDAKLLKLSQNETVFRPRSLVAAKPAARTRPDELYIDDS